MISRVELLDGYSVVVENDSEKQETSMGIEAWSLIFSKKQDVLDHIALLNEALKYWRYD